MLYNTHLETFISVVEAGSFRRAAEKIGISPSAVLKQISLLEQDLHVSVFDRSRKGVTLTEAGESVYRDAKYIIHYCDGASERARELYSGRTNIVRICVSPLTPAHELSRIWPGIEKRCPDIRCRFAPFDSTPGSMELVWSTLGSDSDLVLGVYDEQFLTKWNLQGLAIKDVPAVIAAPPGSPLYERQGQKAEITDLYGETVLLPAEGLYEAADSFRQEVKTSHPQIHLEDIGIYSLEAFYESQNSGKYVFTFDVWELGHLLLHMIPMNWRYQSAYGLLSAREPSDNVRRLLRAAREIL